MLVSVCEPVKVTTVESIAISFAVAVIPVPPTTSNVTVPVVPPPVKPSPAVTPEISPVSGVNHSNVPLPSDVLSACPLVPTAPGSVAVHDVVTAPGACSATY